MWADAQERSMFFHSMNGHGPRRGGAPVDTTLYEIMGVRPNASEDDIKKVGRGGVQLGAGRGRSPCWITQHKPFLKVPEC